MTVEPLVERLGGGNTEEISFKAEPEPELEPESEPRSGLESVLRFEGTDEDGARWVRLVKKLDRRDGNETDVLALALALAFALRCFQVLLASIYILGAEGLTAFQGSPRGHSPGGPALALIDMLVPPPGPGDWGLGTRTGLPAYLRHCRRRLQSSR